MTAPATPTVFVAPFGVDQVSPYINAIPAAPTTPGKASISEGFPAATMTNPTSGGIPPSGADFNGILNAISSWLPFLQSGQRIGYSSAASTAFTGYPMGAVLYVAATASLYQNTLADNTADPSSDVTHWRNLTKPIYAASAPTAGAHNDTVLAGPSNYVLDYDSTAGAMSFSGWVAQFDGQELTISNTGANVITFKALSGSSAANQIRLLGDLAIVQNQTVKFKYSTGAGKWLLA